MKPKVFITRKILPEALDYLKEHTDFEIGSQLFLDFECFFGSMSEPIMFSKRCTWFFFF